MVGSVPHKLAAVSSVILAVFCSQCFAQFGLNQERISEADWSRGFHGFNLITQGNELEQIGLRDFRNSDPKEVLLVVIGKLNSLPVHVNNHVGAGGSALVASDSSRPFNASFAGFRFEKLHSYPTRTDDAFDNMQDCPVIREFREHPIVSGVNEIVTNRPGFISSNGSATLAWFPTEFRVRRRGRVRSFIGASEYRTGGRMVAIGDQSIFTNQMIMYGNNARFADQSLRWLKNDKLKKVLVLVDGAENSALNPADVVVDVPAPTQKEVLDALQDLPPAAMLEFANSVASVVEDENMVNEFIHDTVDNIPEYALNRFYIFLLFGFACFILVAAFLCQRKLQAVTANEVAYRRSLNEQSDIKAIQYQERQQAAHFLLDKFCVELAGRHFRDWPSFPTELSFQDDRESKDVFESMTKMSVLYKSKPTNFWTRKQLARLESEIELWRAYFESRPIFAETV